jgi:hypothetical protein
MASTRRGAGLLAVVLAACGGDGAGGGAGGASSSSVATATSATTTTSSTAGPGGGSGGASECGVDLPIPDPCGSCVEEHCCAELEDCVADPACAECLSPEASCIDDITPDLVACFQSSCEAACDPNAVTPDCEAPAVAPSGGSCVALDQKVTCNPITNEPCDTESGWACDVNGAGYQCWPPPLTEPVCGACPVDDAFCAAGSTCLGVCYKFCCNDDDCGPSGHCDQGPVANNHAPVGVCVQ